MKIASNHAELYHETLKGLNNGRTVATWGNKMNFNGMKSDLGDSDKECIGNCISNGNPATEVNQFYLYICQEFCHYILLNFVLKTNKHVTNMKDFTGESC